MLNYGVVVYAIIRLFDFLDRYVRILNSESGN